MIEIYLLEQLAAFHREGTLSAASQALHLSQPSLSRSMQKLERDLGVSLFDRSKNKISLNETGRLAAEYALKVLDMEEEMCRQIRLFDRSQHTVSIGSCAPGPLMLLLPRIAGLQSDLAVSSSIAEEAALLRGLQHSEYNLILLPHPVEEEALNCREYTTEHLHMSVNCFHPAAALKEITFAEADGQNFIMYAQVGIWDPLVREKMPHSRFYLQSDVDAVGELARYSDLPSFSTDISIAHVASRQNGRLNIPFSDPEATVTYYLIWHKKAASPVRQICRALAADLD